MSWAKGAACESVVEADLNAAIRQLAPQCGYDVFEVARRLIEERRYSVDELAHIQRLIWARRGITDVRQISAAIALLREHKQKHSE